MSLTKITKDNFNQIVESADRPVLIDFFATWCGPCMMLAPTIEELANETDVAIIGKVDVDNDPELANQFSVNVIPTLVVIKDGKVSAKQTGIMTKTQILELISK